MVQGENYYSFDISQKNPYQYIAKIILPHKHIDAIYNEVLIAQKEEGKTFGFSKGDTPLYYIENNFKPNIIEHLKKLFFNHCVINFLYQSLYINKILFVGEPILIDIQLEPYNNAQFIFGLTKISTDWDERWKKINFKAPERKNYKDIDRQVNLFIEEETNNAKNNNSDTINIGDLVLFELEILDKNNKNLLNDYKNQFWIKISDEEADREVRELFLNKKINQTFTTKSSFLQNFISNELNMNYTFSINIKEYSPKSYVSFDLFKHHFQIKNNKHIHQKLAEVFSFRNDISQRREIIEMALKYLLKQYYIPLPQSLLEKQKKIVLASVQDNPDYNVYKAQKDFKEKIKQLAEKQLKEAIIIDFIAYTENIKVSDKDVNSYINLYKRPRTKEFIYFKIPDTKYNGQEMPLSHELIKHQYCLREKTLNYVINYLINKNKKL